MNLCTHQRTSTFTTNVSFSFYVGFAVEHDCLWKKVFRIQRNVFICLLVFFFFYCILLQTKTSHQLMIDQTCGNGSIWNEEIVHKLLQHWQRSQEFITLITSWPVWQDLCCYTVLWGILCCWQMHSTGLPPRCQKSSDTNILHLALLMYSQVVLDASKLGLSLKGNHTTDGFWKFTSSAVFAATVVTTIGMIFCQITQICTSFIGNIQFRCCSVNIEQKVFVFNQRTYKNPWFCRLWEHESQFHGWPDLLCVLRVIWYST